MATDAARWRKMTMAKNREIVKCPRDPGAFVARLTRGYSREQQANYMGMTRENLRACCASPSAPVRLEHQEGDGGHTTQLVYDEDDDFAYVQGRLDLDTEVGRAIKSGWENGKLRYVSAGFTLPPPDYPNKETYPCRLHEVSFVSNPHEPHAEVFVLHSTSEAAQPQQRVNLCSDAVTIAMSQSSAAEKAPAQSGQPDLSGLSSEARSIIEKLVAENNRTKEEAAKAAAIAKEAAAAAEAANNELTIYKHEEREAMQPKLAAIQAVYKENDKLNDDQRNSRFSAWDSLSQNRATAFVVNEYTEQIERNKQLQAQLAELSQKFEAATTDIQSGIQQGHIFAMQQQAAQQPPPLMGANNFAPGAHPGTMPQPPMIAQHAAGGRVVPAAQTNMAADIAARIAARRAEFYNPEGKKQKRTDV